jgi:hypothetical protein
MYSKITQIMRPTATTTTPRSGMGHDATRAASPRPANLRETDLVTAAGAIDRSALMRIAAQRARRETAAYAAAGTPRPWGELLGEELRRGWSIAKVLRECRQGRDALSELSPAELRILQLELQLHKLRRGLATPPGAKTRDDIAHCEALLANAREDESAAMPQRNRLTKQEQTVSHPLDLLIRTLETAPADQRASAKPPDIEGTAAAIDVLIGTLERSLPGSGSGDESGVAPAKAATPIPTPWRPASPARNRACTRLPTGSSECARRGGRRRDGGNSRAPCRRTAQ